MPTQRSRLYFSPIFISFLLMLIAKHGLCKEYYWIGNGGSWFSESHWSFESGGPPTNEIPDINDHVIFDHKSFNAPSIIYVDAAQIKVGSLTVKNISSPCEFRGNSHTSIIVNGSLFIETDRLKIERISSIQLAGTSKKNSVNANGYFFNSDIFFSQNSLYEVSTDLIVGGLNDLYFESNAKVKTRNTLVKAHRIFNNTDAKILSNSTTFLTTGYWSGTENNINGVFERIGILEKNKLRETNLKLATCSIEVVSNYNGRDISCANANDAILKLEIIPAGTYDFAWDGPGGKTWDTQTISNIGPGSYSVVVKANGVFQCYAEKLSLEEPTKIRLVEDVPTTNPSCSYNCDGGSMLEDKFPKEVQGGTFPYTLVWNKDKANEEIGAPATKLCVGNNTLKITDVNNCPGVDTTILILEPKPIIFSAEVQGVACNGGNNGSITLHPNGENGNGISTNYTATYNSGSGPLPMPGLSIGGLSIGSYVIVVTDQNGCSNDTTIEIVEPAPLNAIISEKIDLICNGVCKGKIVLSSSNGVRPYKYQWFDKNTGLSIGISDSVASDLCAGTYYAEVRDLYNCLFTTSDITINQPSEIATNITSKDALCFGDCNGTATISASGGTPFPGSPEYKYKWHRVLGGLPIGQTGNVAIGLCPERYFCEVTDANGCVTNSFQTEIKEPDDISVNLTSKAPKCFSSCDGEIEASVLGGIPKYSYQWKNISADSLFTVDTSKIVGLCKGLYSLLVTDKNACTMQTDTIKLVEPDKLDPVLTTTDVNCNASNNGSAKVVITTGTQPYEYFWSSSANKTNIENNLTAGNYSVKIVDANLCDTTINFQIKPPEPINVSISTSHPSCSNICNGTVTSNVSGGSGNYSYQWLDEFNNPIPEGTSSSLTGLCNGDYTLNVFDNETFCSASQGVTLILPNGVTLSLISKTETTCKNICDGEALISTTGGVPPYSQHIWYDQVSGNPTGDIGPNPTNLCAGAYFVVVEDASGCTDTLKNIEITKLSEIIGVFTPPDTISCFGDCTGSASISGSGGQTPYQYQWIDETGVVISSANTINNLCIGQYSIVITDANKCTSDTTKFVVNSQSKLQITKDSTAASCNGLCDGTAKVVVTGGSPDYTYQWSAGTGNETSPEASNLCAGFYEVKISDTKLCDTLVSFQIEEPALLSLKIVKEDIPCFGNVKGKITVIPTGGTPGYFYKWLNESGVLIPGENSAVIDNLSVGKYTVIVNDAKGCLAKKEVEIIEQTALVISSSKKDNICFGGCEGTISVNVTGGLFPYQFEWLDSLKNVIVGEKGASIEGLCQGKYYINVRDGGSCVGVDSFFILEPQELSVSANFGKKSCFGECEGEIDIIVSGGRAPYKIKWKNKDGLIIGTKDTLSNLCTGEYLVTIEDANLCTKTMGPFLIEEHADIEASFIIDSALCKTNDGQLTVVPTGLDLFTYQWFDNSMNPLGTDSIESNLVSGIYHVRLTSKSTSCSKLFSVPLSNTGGPKLAIDTVINPSCYGSCDGQIQTTVTGQNTPFKFLWSPGGFLTEDIDNLCSNNYLLEVEDHLGCKLVENILVEEPDSINISAIMKNASCKECNGSILAKVSGGSFPYEFEWLDSLKVSIAGEKDSLIEDLCSGKYFLKIIDKNGCSKLDSFLILEPTELKVSVEVGNKNCFEECEGEIRIKIDDGVAPFKILWKDINGSVIGTNDTLSKLCAGNYFTVIEDANLCSKTIGPVVIEQYADIKAGFIVDSALCKTSDGKLTVVPIGGDSYTYQWFDNLMNPLGTDSIESNLSSGIYHVRLTSKTLGCTKIFSVSLSNTGGPKLTIDSIVPPSCYSACDGGVFITVTGKHAPFAYLWNPGGVVTEDIENICSGNYLLEIADTVGCQLFQNIMVDEPDSISISSVKKDATCGECNGSIAIKNLSSNTYLYSWSNGKTTATIDNLCAAIYKVLVTDSLSGCSKELSFNIKTSDGPFLNVDVKKDPTCSSVCDGVIEVSPNGGEGPYELHWLHNGSENYKQENLCKGTYEVIVKDSKECFSISEITLIDSKPIVDSVYIVPSACGMTNGEIHLNLKGGVSPIDILWKHNGSSSSILTNLQSGLYTAHVKDFRGCTESFTYNVPNKDGPAPNFSKIDVICNSGCNGMLILEGDLSGKTYSLLDENGVFISNVIDSLIGLCSGKYWIGLDSAGCVNLKKFIIEEPAELEISTLRVDQISCAGFCDGEAEFLVKGGSLPYQFVWNDPNNQNEAQAKNLCEGNWKINVKDKNGCEVKDSVKILEPEQINVLIEEFKHPICAGIDNGIIDISIVGGTPALKFSWTSDVGLVSNNEDLLNLKEGAYFLQVLDAGNCLYLDTFVLNYERNINANAGVDQKKCIGDTIILNGQSGPRYEWFNSSGDLVGEEANLGLTLDTGSHVFVLKVSDSECFNKDTVKVSVYPLPMVDAGNEVIALRETFATIGGNPTSDPNVAISWTPKTNITGANIANPTVYVDFPIKYYIMVMDQNGCMSNDSVFVRPVPDIVIPTGISPNNDGANDVWVIDGIKEYPNANIEIYNRWGNLLYNSDSGYMNDWDGMADGKPLPAGTYFYIVKLNHPFFPEPLSGPVTIFR